MTLTRSVPPLDVHQQKKAACNGRLRTVTRLDPIRVADVMRTSAAMNGAYNTSR